MKACFWWRFFFVPGPFFYSNFFPKKFHETYDFAYLVSILVPFCVQCFGRMFSSEKKIRIILKLHINYKYNL